MIPPETPEKADELANFIKRAARGAAVGANIRAESSDAIDGNTLHKDAPGLGKDAELAEVLTRWTTLPEAIRRGVLALVRSVG